MFFQRKAIFKEGGGYNSLFSLAAGTDELQCAEVGTGVGSSCMGGNVSVSLSFLVEAGRQGV